MIYKYKAKKGPTKVVEGEIEASSSDNAVTKIRSMGLFPVLLEEVKPSDQKDNTKVKKIPVIVMPKLFFRDRVTTEDIYNFTKQLKILVKSQEPILNSLYFIAAQSHSNGMKKLMETLINDVKDGSSVSEALESHPEYFNALYVSIIKAGEMAGKLDHSLEQIADYMDAERQMARKVMSSLAYPFVMISVGLATIFFMMAFVIPKIRGLFDDMGERLPVMTKMLLATSDFLSNNWIIVICSFLILSGILVYSGRGGRGRRMKEKILSDIPVIKTVIFNQNLHRFSGALSILLSSGISVLEALKISAPLAGNDKYAKQVNKAHDDIMAGMALEESFSENCTFLPEMFRKMVAVGEASGRLDEILAELSMGYAEDVETQARVVTSLIEPLAILLVGGVLSVIVISILLPIFEISMFVR
ncbi:MAG: type II secretion system F family protein [Candidatus Omnitrophica bacterium]|nr:type II secretion system F family protein [Candidatus Omnitrophota bacterium]